MRQSNIPNMAEKENKKYLISYKNLVKNKKKYKKNLHLKNSINVTKMVKYVYDDEIVLEKYTYNLFRLCLLLLLNS